ncbi:MAG: LysE family translocator [Bacteroidota bacterium]
MWVYLLQGIGYGFAAGVQPGPFQAYIISQTLVRGWKHTLLAAFAPLLSDGPIIALCLLVLSQLPGWAQTVLYFAGGCFVLYLAWGAFRAWKNWREAAPPPPGPASQSVIKAALVNALSPGPYIFWTLVTGPILLRGWRETPLHGLGFLGGFYAMLISVLMALILIFGTARRLGPKVSRLLLGVSGLALLGFGLSQFWMGLKSL